MRRDFKKVLCEEPRRKGWGSNGKSLNKLKGSKKDYQNDTKGVWEDWSLPEKESMFGKRRRGTKEFGEHLQPLVRFLRTSVGRKWDEVFSEIRENCPNDNAVNAHIYQHLWGYVERYPRFIDGDVYSARKYYRGELPLRDRGHDNTFYIDQEGILRRAPLDSYRQQRRLKAEEEKKNSDVRVLDGVYYVRKKGIWYKTKLVPLPKPRRKLEEREDYKGRKYTIEKWVYPSFVDQFLGFGSSYGGEVSAEMADKCIRTYGKKVYCSQMRQLNSHQLRQLQLK